MVRMCGAGTQRSSDISSAEARHEVAAILVKTAQAAVGGQFEYYNMCDTFDGRREIFKSLE